MVAIVTREVGATAKGSPLTNAEVDNNFINLEEGKIERFVACKNETGSTAAIGTVVYITGSTGTNPIFALAAASSEATSSKTFGIVWPAAINNNAVGNVITQGIITGLNTSAYSAGAALWLSTTAGSLTATKPTQPNHSVFIGYVVRSHATEGSIQVKILNGYELDELHDVLITSPAYRQFLYRNASNTLWINGFIQDVIGAKIGSAPDEIPLNQYLGDLAYQSSKSVSIDLLNATTISSTNGATIQGLTIGRGAGAVTTNTAVGASALAANTTGSSSVAVGNGALIAQTSGDRNVAVGESALSTNQTGVRNTAIGHVALAANTASYNTALGGYALFSNTTASNNTAVGYQAGYSNTTGNVNVFMGRQAGYGNTTGAANNAFGDLALYTNSTGGYNNAFGRQALYFNTTGDYNTALGSSALYSNTTASNNTAVGYQAGYSVAVNGASVFVGQQAGYYTTASEVTAVGSAALFSNTTGTANVALGRLALFSNTTASNNTAVGYQAGYSGTTGTQNTYLGTQAGYSNTTSNNNTFVGYYCGNATTGGLNTFIGNGAGYLVSSGSKNTIIGVYSGNQGGLDIRTASNYIVLSDGDGNPRGYHDATNWYFPSVDAQTTGGAANVNVGTNGVLRKSTSSLKYKRDVQNATHGLAEVMQLRPVTYKSKSALDGDVVYGGLIAEEVNAVGLSEFVVYAPDGTPDALAYSNMVSLAFKAIQELKSELDSVKAELATLKGN